MIFKFFLTKELKKFPLFFLLLSFTLLLGTLGLVGIGLVSSQVQSKLKENAKQLLTSDIAVSARRPLFSEEQKKLEKLFTKIPHNKYQVIDLYSMVTHMKSKTSRLVEIRATEEGFPFYGNIEVQEREFSNKDLYLSKDLADSWKVSAGDSVKIGETEMKVAGVVTDDSSLGLRGFSLAPRIYVPLDKLPDTGLLRPGATGSFARHFKLQNFSPEKVEEIKKEIFKEIKDSAVKVTLPEDSSDQTARVINTLTNFMSLSALIGLILSLVGVFYLYQSHLLARLKDICLLNLHGLQKKTILLSIVGQFSFIFFLVVLFELLLIIPLYKYLSPLLSYYLSIELPPEVSITGTMREIPFLYGLSLFILVPLLLGLLRTEMGTQLKASKVSMGRFRFFDFLPFLLLLWLFSWYLARSFKTGNFFFFSLMGVFLISTLVVSLGQWILRKIIGNKGLLLPSIESGIALRSLTRSGHKLTLSFLSLTMGAALISLILQLDKMILNEITLDAKKPSLFIFDIQEEQMDPLVEFARKNKTPINYVTPMIRARLEKVNEERFFKKKRNVDLRAREDDQEARLRNNSVNLTYRDYLTDSERIIDGSPFPPGGAADDRLPYISVEKRWAARTGIEIGDKLTFDIQGVEFEGKVLNIKEVKFTSFYPNFFLTIEPGIIDAAPKTFLATLPSVPKEVKLNFQQKVTEKFSNISFIDVEELVGKLSGLFERSRQAIEIISWLSLAVGFVILYGLSHDQVYRRYYDLALMKSLGFTAGQLRLNLLHEFGILFLSALSLGLFLGWLIAYAIAREIFKIAPTIDWPRLLGPAVLLTVLCLATILISSWRAVRARPRELLSDS